jgi:pseudomonalisin
MKICSRTLAAAFTSGAILGLAALTAKAQTATTSSWVSTATQGISLPQLASALDLGPVSPSQALTVRVALNLQNKPALLSLIQAASNPSSPTYGQFLTPAQFAASYGASSAQVSKVVSYLESAGFTNVVVEPNNLLISADGTAQIAESAFHTSIEQFSQFGVKVFGNLAPAQVPASLSGIVSAVLGLNTIGQMKSTIALPSVPQYLVSYTPTQFQQIYSATGTASASRTSIAIMAEGDLTGVVSDLRIAEKAFGLPQVPLQVVQVGLASTDVSGADEWDLDTQYSSGIAGNLKKLFLYDATSLTDSDLALEFSRFATDDKAQAGSASLGECEIFPYLDGSMLVDDMTFLEAAAQGQTFFASAGDTGSFCPVGVGTNGVPAGAPFVNYPASSPYVVGVGGTTLLTNSNGSYDTEVAWYAGGGGLSQFETAPAWQQSAFILNAETGDKGVPDIAYDADPESGATVYVDGAPEGVGGTSLSSPLALGTWARALTKNPKLGFAPIRLYGLYEPNSTVGGTYPEGGFNDIIVGANGLYTALPGYDLTTGLGTPIINQLVDALAK